MLAKTIYDLRQKCYRQEALEIGAVDFPPLKKALLEIVSDAGEYYAAMHNGRICGVLHFENLNINSLIVCPSFQRKGVASMLLDFILKQCKGHTVTVSTAAKNIPAVKLYENFSFNVSSYQMRDGIKKVFYDINL